MKSLRLLASVSAASFALVTLSVAPAHAASGGVIDPVSYSVSDIVVSKPSQQCTSRSLTMKAKRTGSPSLGQNVLIAITTIDPIERYVGHAPVLISNPRLDKNKRTYTAKGRLAVCVSDKHGLGRYKVGYAQLRYGKNVDDMYFGDGDFISVDDYSVSTFHVRAKTKASLSATRAGKTVTLAAGATSYNPEKTSFTAYNAKKAKFQVKSGSKWKTIKTVDLKGGKASVKVKRAAKKQYRVTFSEASRATGATSKTVTK